MESRFAKCPSWLADRFLERGGLVPFSDFMDWALNDTLNGSYASGKLQIGIEGDFVTSPSMSNDFAELLSIQIIEWINEFYLRFDNKQTFSLVEIGPGEGNLSFDILTALVKLSPDTLKKIELVLVEINEGMKNKQEIRLSSFTDINIRWTSFDELKQSPVKGVVIAHEALDALPVEQVVYRNQSLFQVAVRLTEIDAQYHLQYVDIPLTNIVRNCLEEYSHKCNILIPPANCPEGWTSEIHINLNSFFNDLALSLEVGNVLIIDYALPARSYYNHLRSNGTIVTYRKQEISYNILDQAGLCDITSHLCTETVIMEAEKYGFRFIGNTKQGLALLALGLAERISSLSKIKGLGLAFALRKREFLLRLIDPTGLGGFEWILFSKNKTKEKLDFNTKNSFLGEPKKVN